MAVEMVMLYHVNTITQGQFGQSGKGRPLVSQSVLFLQISFLSLAKLEHCKQHVKLILSDHHGSTDD